MTVRAIVLGCFLSFCAGCQPPDESDPGTAAGAEGSDGTNRVVRTMVHPDLPPFQFELVSGGQSSLQQVVVRRADRDEPVQVLRNVELEDWSEGVDPLLLEDLNFDGYKDIGVMAGRPPGPNVPYRYWLYDPGEADFVRSTALDEIVAPVVEPEQEIIRSDWRDGPSRYVSDRYRWVDGVPRLVRREVKQYTEPGVYELTVEARVGEEMVVEERRTVREPQN